MELNEFIDDVLIRIPVLDEMETKNIIIFIGNLHKLGFTVDDATAYCRCMEEVNPDLDEHVALERMEKIRSKYPKGA
jgi:hypothetical protein